MKWLFAIPIKCAFSVLSTKVLLCLHLKWISFLGNSLLKSFGRSLQFQTELNFKKTMALQFILHFIILLKTEFVSRIIKWMIIDLIWLFLFKEKNLKTLWKVKNVTFYFLLPLKALGENVSVLLSVSVVFQLLFYASFV